MAYEKDLIVAGQLFYFVDEGRHVVADVLVEHPRSRSPQSDAIVRAHADRR
jgi:hypothetical protein